MRYAGTDLARRDHPPPSPRSPWPYVSSTFGQLDLAGSPKPNAYWYAANWRELVALGPGKVPLPAAPVARITDLLDDLHGVSGGGRVWRGDRYSAPLFLPSSLSRCARTRPRPYAPLASDLTVNAIASTATAELLVDGVSMGAQPAAGAHISWTLRLPPGSCPAWPTNLSGVKCSGLQAVPAATTAAACKVAACHANALVWQWAPGPGCWAGAPEALPCPPNASDAWVGGGRPAAWAPSNATLLGRDASGAVVATHTVRAPSPPGAPPAALLLGVDVPALVTGTGERLVLDGQVRSKMGGGGGGGLLFG